MPHKLVKALFGRRVRARAVGAWAVHLIFGNATPHGSPVIISTPEASPTVEQNAFLARVQFDSEMTDLADEAARYADIPLEAPWDDEYPLERPVLPVAVDGQVLQYDDALLDTICPVIKNKRRSTRPVTRLPAQPFIYPTAHEADLQSVHPDSNGAPGDACHRAISFATTPPQCKANARHFQCYAPICEAPGCPAHGKISPPSTIVSLPATMSTMTFTTSMSMSTSASSLSMEEPASPAKAIVLPSTMLPGLAPVARLSEDVPVYVRPRNPEPWEVPQHPAGHPYRYLAPLDLDGEPEGMGAVIGGRRTPSRRPFEGSRSTAMGGSSTWLGASWTEWHQRSP